MNIHKADICLIILQQMVHRCVFLDVNHVECCPNEKMKKTFSCKLVLV
jgi:hypothetical protein